MSPASFILTPADLVFFHKCLSSKICIRIFQILLEKRALNISGICRKVGCTNNDGLKHLKNLARLNIVHEDFYAGRHAFALRGGDFTQLMKQAIKVMEKGEQE